MGKLHNHLERTRAELVEPRASRSLNSRQLELARPQLAAALLGRDYRRFGAWEVYGIQFKFIHHHVNCTAAYAPLRKPSEGSMQVVEARTRGRVPRSANPIDSTSADVGRPSVHVGIDVPISCRQTQPRPVGTARRHISPDRQAVPMGSRNAVIALLANHQLYINTHAASSSALRPLAGSADEKFPPALSHGPIDSPAYP
ncbi:hypothetical protein DFH09DRAFT_1096674 [Mycena vulgaris]|nr:hypothetical protein DFH09DRAFT_1096674 [Mycena vulgaris]